MTDLDVPRPAVAPTSAWEFPTGDEARLDNGMRVWSRDIPGQFICSVRLAIPMPSTVEPAGLDGVGTLMARLLDEGTASRSADEMAELLERRGCAFSAHLNDDGLLVALDVPARRLRAGLELLTEALSEPAFGGREVTRHVRQRLAEIDHDRAQPDSAAALTFLEEYYDSADRFSRPMSGTSETVAALTPQALRAHHDAYVRPGGAVVAVCGDHSDVDVAGALDATLGTWHPSASAPATPPATEAGVAQRASRVVVVDRPGSVQSEVYIGSAAPNRSVPTGWAPYPVLAMILGGAPQARLDAVLREEKGYTYGMRCGFRPRTRGGLFVTSGAVRTDATADALRLTLDILDEAGSGFGVDETRDAVDFVARTAPGRYATADAVAGEVAARSLDGSGGPAHTRSVLADLPHVTPERLAEAYARVSRERLVVVVGDAATFVDELRAAGHEVRVRG